MNSEARSTATRAGLSWEPSKEEVNGGSLKGRNQSRMIRLVNGIYQCPRPNGLLGSEQGDYPVPLVDIEALLAYRRRMVEVR